MQSWISLDKKWNSKTSWSTGYSWNIFLPLRHNSSSNRRTLSGVKMTDLPLLLVWFDRLFWVTIPEAERDLQHFLNYIYNTHSHRISQWNQTILDAVSLERNVEAVYDKGAALDNYIGFTAGTVRPICRTEELQRVVYNGHKRVHALKFQSFTLPNGMIANM